MSMEKLSCVDAASRLALLRPSGLSSLLNAIQSIAPESSGATSAYSALRVRSSRISPGVTT
jgi:hypothetical protein